MIPQQLCSILRLLCHGRSFADDLKYKTKQKNTRDTFRKTATKTKERHKSAVRDGGTDFRNAPAAINDP